VKRFVLTVLILCFAYACSSPVRPPAVSHNSEIRDSVTLYSHPLELRLEYPRNPAHPGILVLYSTGDGGWRPLDESFLEWISSWGYPVAGFSAKNYLKNLGYVSNTTTPRRLVRDFQLILDAACSRLELPPDAPVILVGLSRGAGLSVVAAGQPGLRSRLLGVVAVALTPEEEHVIHVRHRGVHGRPATPDRERVEIKTYEYLPHLALVPVTVIQSTNDRYIPAAAARKLFGPDTELRRFIPIESANHSFRGGTETLFRETEVALDWVQQVRRGVTAGTASTSPAAH
jgi:hypothetical protein